MAQLWGYIKYADRPAGKKQQEWYPMRCTYDVDGRAVLQVDTELNIDGATLNIDNLFVASDDGAASGAKYIKVAVDGTIQIAGTVSTTKGNPVHYNGNSMLVAADINFASAAKHVQFENMDILGNNIYISFDAGVKYRTIKNGEIIDIDCDSVSSIKTYADADNTPYEILTLE